MAVIPRSAFFADRTSCAVRGDYTGSFASLRATKRWMSDLFPKFLARVFRVQLRQFAQQFFGAFVPRHRYGDGDLNDLIPARAFFCCRRHALLPKPQFLAGLRSRRNL